MKPPSFQLHPQRPRLLLLADGAGIDTILNFAESLLTRGDAAWKPLVLLGSDAPFPFRTRPSTILLPGMPDGAIACVPKLDEWGVPSRLASLADLPGCFDGTVTELARAWLASLGPDAVKQTEMLACGATEMLQAVAALGQHHGLACQLLSAPDTLASC